MWDDSAANPQPHLKPEPERADPPPFASTQKPSRPAQSGGAPLRQFAKGLRRHLRAVFPLRATPVPPPVAADRAITLTGTDFAARSGDKRALLDLSPDGALLVSSTGVILALNRAGEALTGLHTFEMLAPRFDVPQGTARVLALANGHRAEVRALPAISDGRPVTLVTIRDIDAHPFPGADLIAADLAKLRNTNAALGDFAVRVAHDLKAPLRGISGLATILEEDEGARLSKDGRDMLAQVSAAARRLQALVVDTLDYAQLGDRAQCFAPVDLNAVVASVMADLHADIDAAGALCTADPLPTVMGCKTELYELFLNLLSNALKYRGRAKTRIRITAETLSRQDDAPRARIRIADNGLGFSDFDAERIFEPFTRLLPDQVTEGTGIGLATARKIARRHGGSIRASGKPGVGASFYVDLPKGDVASAAPAAVLRNGANGQRHAARNP
ncbi:MAG: ATP-binding protein [Pseudomonadota bacterium]